MIGAQIAVHNHVEPTRKLHEDSHPRVHAGLRKARSSFLRLAVRVLVLSMSGQMLVVVSHQKAAPKTGRFSVRTVMLCIVQCELELSRSMPSALLWW
jgi:hypothetical protein